MNKFKKLKTILFLLLGLGVLVYFLARMDIDFKDIDDTVKSPWYIILILPIILVIDPLITALRLKYIVTSIEKKSLAIKDLFLLEYATRFLYSVMPFKLNLPAKATLLNKKCGIRLDNSVSAVSFEYVFDSCIIIFFSFFGMFTYFRDDSRVSFASIEYFVVINLILGGIFFFIPSDYYRNLMNHTDHISIKILRTVANNLAKFMWTIRNTWITMILNRGIFKVLGISLIYWSVAVIIFELLFLSTGTYVSFIWILIAVTSGFFVGGISTIPGGIGVREAGMIIVYGYFGVPAIVSVPVVLLGRGLSIFQVIIGYIAIIKIAKQT